MKIRCENCHTEFQFDLVPGADGPLHAPCPECEYPNPLGADRRGQDGASVIYTQCFNCGRSMIHNVDLAIPICKNCQEGEEQLSSVREWMIKKLNGQIYGPFDAETIQTWIEAAKIEPRDGVAKVGGQWKRFEEHPVFSRCFPNIEPASGAAPAPTLSISQPAPAPSMAGAGSPAARSEIDWRRWLENVVAVAGGLAIVGGCIYLIQNETLVVPEPWVDEARSSLKGSILGGTDEKSLEASPQDQAFNDVLERLHKQHPEVSEPSSTLFTRGRALFLQDTERSLARARQTLEQAVAKDPTNDLALSALAEAYARGDDPNFQKDASVLVERASQINRGSAEVMRARAAFLSSTRNLEESRKAAIATLEINPNDAEAHYYVGMSFLQQARPVYVDALAHLRQAVSANPGFHRAYHQLGAVYLERLEYRKADQAIQAKLKLEPENARALALMARLQEEVGDTGGALRSYQLAYRASQGEEALISLAYAALLYQGANQLAAARSILSELLPAGAPSPLSLPDQKQALTHLATVQRLSGEKQVALETLDRLASIDPSFGPGLFQRGLLNLELGQLDDAGKALRAISGEVASDVQSDVKHYLGLILASQGKIKDAVEELSDAVDAFKFNLRPRIQLVHVLLQGGQSKEAIAVAKEGAIIFPLYMAARSLRTLYYHRPPSSAHAASGFESLAREQFYLADLTANLGMYQLQAGQRGAAMQTFQKALQVSEGNSSALLNLAVLAMDQGEPRVALPLLDRLLDHNSQLGLAYVLQGRALTELGQLDSADLAFQKALRYERTNPLLHDGIGLLSVKQGNLERARESFVQAVSLDERFVPPRAHLYKLVP